MICVGQTIAYMVLAIITAVESLSLLILTVFGVAFSPCTINCDSCYYYQPCDADVNSSRFCARLNNLPAVFTVRL